MKLTINHLLVYISFSLLLVHSFIPHHHHHSAETIELGHHHDDDHDHHHHPASFHSVEENFVLQSYGFQLNIPVSVVTGSKVLSGLDEPAEKRNCGFEPIPEGHPPSPPFLKAFSFRGPPTV